MSWIFVLLDLWGLGFSSAFEAAVGASVRGPGLVLPTCKLDHQASDVGRVPGIRDANHKAGPSW